MQITYKAVQVGSDRMEAIVLNNGPIVKLKVSLDRESCGEYFGTSVGVFALFLRFLIGHGVIAVEFRTTGRRNSQK